MPPAGGNFRIRNLIDDYLMLGDVGYGWVEDVIFSQDGAIEAVVAEPAYGYGYAPGRYAFPYNRGYDPYGPVPLMRRRTVCELASNQEPSRADCKGLSLRPKPEKRRGPDRCRSGPRPLPDFLHIINMVGGIPVGSQFGAYSHCGRMRRFSAFTSTATSSPTRPGAC
jgi:hypothetical protein